MEITNYLRGQTMNGFLMQERWADVRERIMTKWGKFTRREVDALRVDLDYLVAQIQKSYGYERQHAEREYHEFRLAIRPIFYPVEAGALNDKLRFAPAVSRRR